MSSKSSPRDFSLFSLFTAGLACFVPLASAYTQPKGSAPAGNPIHTPGLNDVVPAGKDYTVTWQPTTSGTVTLVLLKGPSADALPQYPIAEKIPNDGKFVWKPSTDLVPGQTGYGIQLIDDATGQYQYSTQFGISNADHEASSDDSSSSSSTSTSSSSSSSSDAAPATTATTKQAPAKATAQPIANTTTPCSTTLSKTWVPSGTGTGVPAVNSTIVLPTKPMTVPASLVTATVTAPAGSANATASRIPSHSNGAASAHVATSFLGLVVAAGVAVLAL